MARADSVTLIPLDRVATVMGIDPLHFNGVISALRPLRNACDDFWLQYDYQQVGRTSRETMASALKQAEMAVMSHLGFPIAWMWISGEETRIDQVARTDAFGVGSINVRGLKKSLRTRWGYVQECGTRTATLVQGNAAVVYNDSDGDGYKETATVVVATTVTDIEELMIFYPSKSGDPRWEIRPVNISLAGGNATITFRREQTPTEENLEKLVDLSAGNTAFQIDGDVDANFLTTVDVYRVYTDPSQQATFYTEGSCTSCGGVGCTVCQLTAETGCLTIRDKRLGILTYDRADWDAVSQAYEPAGWSIGRTPDKAKIWYRAGWDNPDDQDRRAPKRRVDPVLERLIIYYAFTLIDSEAPGCDNTRRIIHHNLRDLAQNTSSGQTNEGFQVSDALLNNPFGTTRAAVNLWNYIKTSHTGRLVTAR